LQFNLSAGQSSGYLEKTTNGPIDYTNYLNTSTGFLWVYLPTGTAVTSITVFWGSSSSAYYSYTATATQQGTAFQTGWNLIALPWASATVVGSPVASSTSYTRVTLNYNSTLQTGVKICNLTFNLGYIFEAVYYSKYLFRDPSTNTFQETVTDTTDSAKVINLDTESYNLLFNKLAMYVAQSLQGSDAEYDMTVWTKEYETALAKYKALNPSESMIKATSYYKQGNTNYNRFGNNNNRW